MLRPYRSRRSCMPERPEGVPCLRGLDAASVAGGRGIKPETKDLLGGGAPPRIRGAYGTAGPG